MAGSACMIEVGWEYEVPLAEVVEARDALTHELESYYHVSVRELTDKDVARFLVRRSHPGSRYLCLDGAQLHG